MHKPYIALFLIIFAVSLIGCTTTSSMYQVPKEEIKKPTKAPEAIVVFPKDFPEAKKSYMTSNDNEKYLRYAKAMEKINVKMKQRAINRKNEQELEKQRRQIEWEKELERRKAVEVENERYNNYNWYFGHYPYFWGYYPSVRSGLLIKRYNGSYYTCFGSPTWFGLPLYGQRLIIWSATHKQVLGSKNQPTTQGTTYIPGKVIYPSK